MFLLTFTAHNEPVDVTSREVPVLRPSWKLLGSDPRALQQYAETFTPSVRWTEEVEEEWLPSEEGYPYRSARATGGLWGITPRGEGYYLLEKVAVL